MGISIWQNHRLYGKMCISSDKYLHLAANTTRKRGNRKQKSYRKTNKVCLCNFA